MTTKDYIEKVSEININQHKVSMISQKYGSDFPDIVSHILSDSDETIFFDDNIRKLSFSEIYNAEQELHVAFISKHILPLFDCCDNDFIVFDMSENKWSKFNIIDEVLFKNKTSITELL